MVQAVRVYEYARTRCSKDQVALCGVRVKHNVVPCALAQSRANNVAATRRARSLEREGAFGSCSFRRRQRRLASSHDGSLLFASRSPARYAKYESP